MPIEIVRNDITLMQVDAIVNAANESLLGGGGVDGAIHRAAGPELLAECRTLHGCKTGDAKITGAYRLPCRYVIHTVGPVWRGGDFCEEALLTSCYRKSLALAIEHGCRSVAFPLISAGVYGYPKKQALKVALDTVQEFLMENDLLVYIVVFDKDSFGLSSKLFAGVAQYIDDHYADLHRDLNLEQRRMMNAKRCFAESMPVCAPAPDSLEAALEQIDESFSQMVLRRIDEAGISDSACYKKANLDRKLFSKIRSDVHYKPSKRTALALAIGLELNLDDTRDLLMKAGFALSHSSKFDIIIEYFILNGNYNICEINEALFFFDQPLLGA